MIWPLIIGLVAGGSWLLFRKSDDKPGLPISVLKPGDIVRLPISIIDAKIISEIEPEKDFPEHTANAVFVETDKNNFPILTFTGSIVGVGFDSARDNFVRVHPTSVYEYDGLAINTIIRNGKVIL